LTQRTVVVDTAYTNAIYFRDKFSHYFSSRQERLILSLDDQAISLNELNVFPEVLQGRLDSYNFESQEIKNSKRRLRVDILTGQPITFDFTRDYPHTLLVHHQAGGGRLSHSSLLRLSLKNSLVDELISRIDRIGGSWIGVHIRNTDYSTDYQSLIDLLKKSSPKRIFLATDSLEVKQRFESEFSNEKVYSFSQQLSVDGKPLHRLTDLDETNTALKNIDAILDLVMLGLSSRLLFQEVSPNQYGTKYSGYALLAQHLWSTKIVLKNFISDPRIKFGLN
jgi:hypothetical protein